ncbi:MAG: CsiV family protein [Gammaproteobacteria bacterium]|nr:CsiV family protein [Gammaproteobacteria bacterium]
MPLRLPNYVYALASLLIALMAIQSNVTHAADNKENTWYQIEVIVAKRTDSSLELESFPFQPTSAAWHRGQHLTNFNPVTDNYNDLENVEFIRLPKDQHTLNNQALKLQDHEDYTVLFHQGWRQILKGNKAINWIDIKDGYAWAGHQQLEGSLGFSKGRYLHVHSELHLNRFSSVASLREKQALLLTEQTLAPIIETRYSLIQRRKMRSNELHYLDHPKLALLVKIIPFTPAEPIIEAPAINDPVLIDLTEPADAE